MKHLSSLFTLSFVYIASTTTSASNATTSTTVTPSTSQETSGRVPLYHHRPTEEVWDIIRSHNSILPLLLQYEDIRSGSRICLQNRRLSSHQTTPYGVDFCGESFDFASCSANNQEHEFLQKLFFKNSALLLGDYWISGQESGPLQAIEGGTVSFTALYLNEILFSTPSLPKHLDLSTVKGLEESSITEIGKLKDILKLSAFIENVFKSSMTKQEKSAFLAYVFAEYTFDGEEFLFPVFTRGFNGNHVFLLSLVKSGDTATLKVINTGDGLKFHDGFVDIKNVRRNFVKTFEGLDIKKDILDTNFFELISEFSDHVDSQGEDYNAEHFYRCILGRFSSHEAAPSPIYLNYSIPQRTGNCFQKVFFAYLKTKIGAGQFKLFERAAKGAAFPDS